MNDFSGSMYNYPVPQLNTLRRVPLRFRRILPLKIMQHYKCIVVGAAPGVLTVAIADRQNMAAIELLTKYTRRAIFPVLIDPDRMCLLIRRIEKFERYNRNFFSRWTQQKEAVIHHHTLLRIQISSIVTLLSSHSQKPSWSHFRDFKLRHALEA